MSAVNFNNQEWAKSNFNDFIVPKYIAAPYTTIQNRAQVLDASNMLQAVMGIERVPFRGINLLQKEFGVNGEQVWELESKDARVRFVGSGWISFASTYGSSIQSSTVNDYIEFNFYGTGINLLGFLASSYDARVTIDNNSEIAVNIYVASLSGILGARNYLPNQVLNLTSGLTLGWHTVKLRTNASTPTYDGFEILNQSTSLTIPPGQAFIGNKKDSLAVLTTSAYNAGFSGTKGGRSCKYLLNGQVSQVVRECAATPSYLTNANHADEEVVRRINFREFGANRSDDFSTVTTSRAAAFTLDDGSTSLVGDSVAGDNVATGYLSHNGNSNFFTITFTGTGLDIVRKDSVGGGADTYTIFVDGVSQGTLNSTGSTSTRTEKICSGLPYCSHTVKIVRTTAATFSIGVSDFIIYQPKALTLPVGAIQIADYNVMANYSKVSSPTVLGQISQGVMRKNMTREFTYVGTWTQSGGGNTSFEGGFNIASGTANDYIEYSFFGTGVLIYKYFAGAATFQFTLDGSTTNFSSYTSSFTPVNGMTGLTWTASTGQLSGTPSGGTSTGFVEISGLALGWHKIKVLVTGAANHYTDVVDVICPIHFNHPTLKVGSLGLMNTAKLQAAMLPVSGPDLSKAKAWVFYDQVNSKILGSFNISQVLNISTGISNIYFIKPFKNANYSVGGMGSVAQIGDNGTSSKTTNYYQTILSNSAGTTTNGVLSLQFYGEQFDE